MQTNRWFPCALAFLTGSALASVSPTEVVTLPSSAAYGGGDAVGSDLIAATYNAGGGPGIWIVADGGYRLYVNGELLAEDNQAGRVAFVPYTFLPGENAVSVVGVNGSGAPGVMVQIDELEKSYYSGSGWYAKSSVSNAAWKAKGRDLSQWGGATTLSYASTALPSGGTLSGFPNEGAKWIWTASEDDPTALLLYTFNIKAEGFGANTTGGGAGTVVFAKDSATVRQYLQKSDAYTILVPEGTYDFRQFRNAATEATAAGRTWCSSSCGTSDANYGSATFYRISFTVNSCSGLSEVTSIVPESAGLQKWDDWIRIAGNKSLVGMGRGANLRGASLVSRTNDNFGSYGNNLFRNLAIYDVNPHLVEGGDGLEVAASAATHLNKFWADHISYKWISDGMDMEYLDSATISYLDFDGRSEYNCWGTDPYMALVEDAQLTYANNYWHGTYGRVPKVTGESKGSTVHLYNQYVDTNYFFIVGASGASSSIAAKVLYENNYVDHAFGYLSELGDYGYVNFSNVTLGSTSKNQYRNNGTVTSGVPTSSNAFTPTYSYVLRAVSTLPDSVPHYAGVGGRWGSMPAYDRSFGISPVAATVSLSVTGGEELATLSATVSSSSGASISKVEFYVGTTLVGTATSSPYGVTVSDISAGTYSAVAVATDANSLRGTSAYVTFTVEPSEGVAVSAAPLAPKASLYRVFDLQGRLLYGGASLKKFPGVRTMTVEYDARGSAIRRYLNR